MRRNMNFLHTKYIVQFYPIFIIFDFKNRSNGKVKNIAFEPQRQKPPINDFVMNLKGAKFN